MNLHSFYQSKRCDAVCQGKAVVGGVGSREVRNHEKGPVFSHVDSVEKRKSSRFFRTLLKKIMQPLNSEAMLASVSVL